MTWAEFRLHQWGMRMSMEEVREVIKLRRMNGRELKPAEASWMLNPEFIPSREGNLLVPKYPVKRRRRHGLE